MNRLIFIDGKHANELVKFVIIISLLNYCIVAWAVRKNPSLRLFRLQFSICLGIVYIVCECNVRCEYMTNRHVPLFDLFAKLCSCKRLPLVVLLPFSYSYPAHTHNINWRLPRKWSASNRSIDVFLCWFNGRSISIWYVCLYFECVRYRMPDQQIKHNSGMKGRNMRNLHGRMTYACQMGRLGTQWAGRWWRYA